MGLDQAFIGMFTARAEAFGLNRPLSRPIWGVSGRKTPRRPGGAGRGVAQFGGVAAGRAAAVLAMRIGGGKA